MKTTTMRTAAGIFSAGILLTSCVSSKKYHRSQAEVARLRADSTTLAQQGQTLQQSLTSMQQKNTDLQKSYEAANTTNAGLQKSVAYYHDYFDKQQAATAQAKDELKTTLAPAGIADQDIVLTDGKIYINIGEKNLFKGNSAMLSSKGRDLVNNLGQFVKSHDAIDVSVADLETSSVGENGSDASGTANMGNGGATGSGNSATNSGGNGRNGNMTGTSGSTNASGTDQSNQSSSATSGTGSSSTRTYARHTRRTRSSGTNSGGNSGAGTNGTSGAGTGTNATGSNGNNNSSSSTASSTAVNNTTRHPRAVHHKRAAQPTSGESNSVAYSSGHHNRYAAERMSRSTARAMAWKRQNVVAEALLKNGIPKVKLVEQTPGNGGTGGQKGVQVVLVHDMDNLYKHMTEGQTGQPVSSNP